MSLMETHHRPSWKMKMILMGKDMERLESIMWTESNTALHRQAWFQFELSVRRTAVSHVTAWSGGSPQALPSTLLLSSAIWSFPAAWLLECRWKSLVQKSLEHSLRVHHTGRMWSLLQDHLTEHYGCLSSNPCITGDFLLCPSLDQMPWS